MNENIRILGIAPYETLRTNMVKIAKERDDFTMDIFLGNMKEGVDIAKFHENDNYDVIISRGATSRLIKEAVHIPVVSVEFSAYDILRAMKLAENYSYRYAILGFPGITGTARILCDLLQKNIEIVTIYHEEDAKNALRDLKDRGFSMVICGTVGEDYAKKAGLSSILILSGDECIEVAFDQAVEISRGYAYMKEKKVLYEKVLESEKGKVFLFNDNQELCFSNWNADAGKLKELLCGELDTMPPEGYEKIQEIRNTLYEIKGSWLEVYERQYGLFRLQEWRMSSGISLQGLLFSNKKQAESYYYNSFYGVSGALGQIEEKISAFAKTAQPIFITGEEGSGKDQIARFLYMNSLFCSNSFITVDCESVNDKSWAFLMNGTNSPFLESNQTYYFRNLDRLTENKCRQLQFMMLERNLHHRNRIIVTCVSEKEKEVPERLLRFINQFSCAQICLPPLRVRKEELPMLTSLYIAKKNAELSKQILGFEPGGMKLLQDYDWPFNYAQLKRVLDELVSITDSSYISHAVTEQLLKTEEKAFGKTKDSEIFDFDRTLDEITRDIINRELKRMNGNQTAVAKKLGISRTTLWRYFKE